MKIEINDTDVEFVSITIHPRKGADQPESPEGADQPESLPAEAESPEMEGTE